MTSKEGWRCHNAIYTNYVMHVHASEDVHNRLDCGRSVLSQCLVLHRLSHSEAALMDPQARILLEQTSLALDAAVCQPTAHTGVYVGVMHMEYIQHITGRSGWFMPCLHCLQPNSHKNRGQIHCLEHSGMVGRARCGGHAKRVNWQRHGLPRGSGLLHLRPPGERDLVSSYKPVI